MFDAGSWLAFFAAFPWAWPASAAFVGAVAASFGGVVVDRLPYAEGWNRDPPPRDPRQADLPGVPPEALDLRAPSRCPRCGARIGALDLVPVLGWLARGGRCARCRRAVPWIYPAAEAASAACSAGVAVLFGPGEAGIWALCALWACLVLAWMDAREHWLMDRLTVPLLLAGLLASPFAPDPVSRLHGMALCAGTLWAIFAWLGHRRGEDTMSGGDLVLAAAAGAWLGTPSVPAFLGIAGLAFVAYSLPARRRGEEWAPLGPALCAALLACLCLGERIAIAAQG